MLVSTQHQKGLEQKIFCKQMLVKFVIYISPCQYAEFMAAQTVQSGKTYTQIQRRDLEMVSSESISLADAKRYYRRARHNWLPSALILNAIIYHDCKPYIWVHKLSNLWWMYNSVSKGLGHDIIIGSSQQFQRNTLTYYFKSSLLYCRLG